MENPCCAGLVAAEADKGDGLCMLIARAGGTLTKTVAQLDTSGSSQVSPFSPSPCYIWHAFNMQPVGQKISHVYVGYIHCLRCTRLQAKPHGGRDTQV